MYKTVSLSSFDKAIKKLKKKDFATYSSTVAKIKLLRKNPFDPILRTHQVNTPTLGKMWSSRVTGDLRIIWEFSADNELVLLLIRLDGHDGVYR